MTHSNTDLSFNQQTPYSDFFLRQDLIQSKAWGKDDTKPRKVLTVLSTGQLNNFKEDFDIIRIQSVSHAFKMNEKEIAYFIVFHFRNV